MTAAVDPIAVIAGHRRCTRQWCRKGYHGVLVWLDGPAGPGEFERQALAAGVVLSSITRPRGELPARPEGLPARYKPWLVSWARPAPATRQAATDARSGDRGAVEPDEGHDQQLELFPSGATLAASHGSRRSARGT